MPKDKVDRRFVKIVGDCGHPWYVLPTELDDEIKSKPLKCPFCSCEGAAIYELLGEIRHGRQTR